MYIAAVRRNAGTDACGYIVYSNFFFFTTDERRLSFAAAGDAREEGNDRLRLAVLRERTGIQYTCDGSARRIVRESNRRRGGRTTGGGNIRAVSLRTGANKIGRRSAGNVSPVRR